MFLKGCPARPGIRMPKERKRIMDKNGVALYPPMGWNSWDCFGAAVTEAQLMENAVYMKEKLKKYGWEYIVCDIQWYEPTAWSTEYNDFVPLEMDGYSRLIPAVNRFPSAAGGVGFKKIAQDIHDMGLKFGIHIMRGIPRQAVHANTPLKGTTATARQIAQRFSVCSWNTDMYGVDPCAYGAQAYYDSLFEMYAEWGIDLVKVDDICNTFFKPYAPYSARNEIEMIRRAIDKCGREIVLSLSPGPADFTQRAHLAKNANMWRMTADFWDRWDDLYAMFEKCDLWSPYVGEGCWPDCDMLPLGHICIKGNTHGLTERYTSFSREEQRTMVTLWCIFRSPLMFGGNMPDNDEWTESLITNEEVLRLVKFSHGARQVLREGGSRETIVWKSYDRDGSVYVAIFNTYCLERHIEVSLRQLELEGRFSVRDLWERKELGTAEHTLECVVPCHGVKLLKLREWNG